MSKLARLLEELLPHASCVGDEMAFVTKVIYETTFPCEYSGDCKFKKKNPNSTYCAFYDDFYTRSNT